MWITGDMCGGSSRISQLQVLGNDDCGEPHLGNTRISKHHLCLLPGVPIVATDFSVSRSPALYKKSFQLNGTIM